jgi:hypothetical protein
VQKKKVAEEKGTYKDQRDTRTSEEKREKEKRVSVKNIPER